MSRCWKCNKEFYSEYLSQTLCDECLGRIPRATATTDFAKIEIAEKEEFKIDYENIILILRELEYRAVAKQKQRPNELYFKDALCEVFIELQNSEHIDLKIFNRIADLEAKLAESEKKLNQYPYKNDVIEKQYEELKNGIKFRFENNITDDWTQLYHCIDVLCEKHKARIRDIENGICSIEKLKQQLAEKEKEIFFYQNVIKKKPKTATEMCELLRPYELKLRENEMYKDRFESLYNHYNQDKISFAVEQLKKVKDWANDYYGEYSASVITNYIDNQIKQLKEGK